jgi:hypothetical protein
MFHVRCSRFCLYILYISSLSITNRGLSSAKSRRSPSPATSPRALRNLDCTRVNPFPLLPSASQPSLHPATLIAQDLTSLLPQTRRNPRCATNLRRRVHPHRPRPIFLRACRPEDLHRRILLHRSPLRNLRCGHPRCQYV